MNLILNATDSRSGQIFKYYYGLNLMLYLATSLFSPLIAELATLQKFDELLN